MRQWQGKGVLFDLDGTLVDTAGDLHAVLNQLLVQYQRPAVSLEQIIPIGSDGIYPLLDLAFEAPLSAENKQRLRAEFIAIYQQNPPRHSRLFSGIEEVLAAFNEHHIPWGIVTNKPTKLTLPLFAKYQVLKTAKTLVCGDTLGFKKPHPAPMHHARAALNIDQGNNILYVGDAKRDIDAGIRADMHTAIAAWGYIHATVNIQDWGAGHILRAPTELLQLTI
ncbi:HAD family hydrolase [Thalassotalea litorea]|uniref:HAD family hydrolase n=1 Tax=Thalassotalea litorea TaxID=2020715 RepID=A0A5R9IVJ6_9GAMM|nr:HAD-IA family hydrolase [Thalassotalea litorea]TLU68107.1 HAD family hydrolase [Thalassotalea litorea]